MLSDHSLIITTFDIIDRCAADKSTIKRRPWRLFDYDAFAADLEESELILDPPTDVNKLFVCYDETLIRLLDKHDPLWKLKVKARSIAPWFDAECRDSKVITRKLEKAYQHHPTTKSKTPWKAQFIKQKVLYQQKFVSHWSTAWSTAISSCQSDSKVLWSKLRPLLQPEPGSTSQLTTDEFAWFISDKIERIRASTAATTAPPVIEDCLIPESLSVFQPATADEVAIIFESITCQAVPARPSSNLVG